ncbi:MAG: DUF1549 domain-containing protein [Pirellulales bacterium]
MIESNLATHIRRLFIRQIGYVVLSIGFLICPARALHAQTDAERIRASAEQFRDKVAPLLARRCVECHRSDRREGGLSLTNAAEFAEGGDSGPAVRAGDVATSEVLTQILPAAEDEKPNMPKGRPPLASGDVENIRKWIASGAVWPSDIVLKPTSSADDAWWSLQPIRNAAVPAVNEQLIAWVSSPIDSFVAAKWDRPELGPSPRAAKREWLRRVTLDLTGLPPTIEALEEFESNTAPDAKERVVDRLLASPAYGEKAARRWLDLVHYGETHGYDKDKPRPSAWPYRDYVIRSFNEDKDYGQFVREQIAGDVLNPADPSAVEALGFLSAGPWDFIGHAEVPETKIDGKIARHLDRDDMVQNTMVTFQSLTVGCAQCHDHKFDPVSQREYYGLQAVFAALDRSERTYYSDAKLQKEFVRLQAEQSRCESEFSIVRQKVEQAAGPTLKTLEDQIQNLRSQANLYPPEHGYHSAIADKADQTKWVQLDFGSPQTFTRLAWTACHDDFAGIGDGFGFPLRFRIEASDDPSFNAGVVTLVDRTSSDALNPGIQTQQLDLKPTSARYVRFTAVKLAERKNDYIFALSELQVFDSEGTLCSGNATVTALDSIEAPPRWRMLNIVDGKAPRSASSKSEIDAAVATRDQYLKDHVPSELLSDLNTVERAREDARKAMAALPSPARVYSAMIHTGQGAFTGTGGQGGKPRPIYLLARGDVRKPTDPIAPQTIRCVSGLEAELADIDSPDGDRRTKLAMWLTSPDNVLTWRSAVNRVWQSHFGRGIVSTPNDFGHMGSLPTHPELLDSLAAQFRDNPSIKRLRRQLVLSSTYAQSSQAGDEDRTRRLSAVDPDNAMLAKMSRRRLDAEEIRDSLLMIGGSLDRTMGGPSYQDFVVEHPEHSPHYEYRLHDPFDPKTHRRSIYRMIVRSQTQPMLTSLDCADPSMQVDVRTESNSPSQALTMLNNRFSLMAAELWAAGARRIVRPTVGSEDAKPFTSQETEQAVRQMWYQALGRTPQPTELSAMTEYSEKHGLAATARIVFNLNEFLYVD